MHARLALALLALILAGCSPHIVPRGDIASYTSSPPSIEGTILKASIAEVTVQPALGGGERTVVRVGPETGILTRAGESWPAERPMVGYHARIWYASGGAEGAKHPVAAVVEIDTSVHDR